MNNNTDYNSDRMHYPVDSSGTNENKKWDACNLRQENAKYGFNVMPGGFISSGGRAQTVYGGGGKFPDFESKFNPLDLINKK